VQARAVSRFGGGGVVGLYRPQQKLVALARLLPRCLHTFS
jgi:hypothetical protein